MERFLLCFMLYKSAELFILNLICYLRTCERTVRALYDFEAAEDNELSFVSGDLITVTDDRFLFYIWNIFVVI